MAVTSGFVNGGRQSGDGVRHPGGVDEAAEGKFTPPIWSISYSISTQIWVVGWRSVEGRGRARSSGGRAEVERRFRLLIDRAVTEVRTAVGVQGTGYRVQGYCHGATQGDGKRHDDG